MSAQAPQPAGFVVAEAAINNEDVLGFRWTVLSEHVTTSFIELARVMLGPDPAKLSANSQQALLAKVLNGLNKVSGASDREKISKRVKVEFLQAVGTRAPVKTEPSSSSQTRPASAGASSAPALKKPRER